MSPIRSGLLARLVATVRARLLALLLVAAVPLFAMAVSVSLQNYRMVTARTRQQADMLLAVGGARYDLELGEAARVLAALAVLPGVREGPARECESTLDRALALMGDRMDAVLVLDAKGNARCASGAMDQAMAKLRDQGGQGTLFVAARDSMGFEVGSVATDEAGAGPLLITAQGLRTASGFAGAVLARLRVGRLWSGEAPDQAPGSAAWIVGPQRRAVAVRGQGSEAMGLLPRPEILDSLLAASRPAGLAASRLGAPFDYASMRLRGDATLLVGVPAAPDLARANAVLGKRLAELGLLLIAGLVAVALGADAAVMRPLQRLSEAVRAWRDGGAFGPGPDAGAPVEIVELGHTFGQAASALRTRETELHAAITRQELLMQEIHHRVKNNLQIVASLLNLQATRIRLPEARAEFQAARDRVRALATLHRHLYAHGELHTINMGSFLRELCDQLLQAIGETPAGGRIAIEIEAPELQLSSDQAVPMALIVTEAVSNAAKYAFPGGRSGHIGVHLAVLTIAGAQPVARLVIQDDGVGIPSGQADTETGVRDGIGIRLIGGFVRQLGATLHVTQDGGTRYVVDIPLHRERDVDRAADTAFDGN